MASRASQFVTRAKNAVSRFHRGADYETTMDLLTEHAHRVGRLSNRTISRAAQAVALNEIYALMEWVQAKAPAVVVSNQFANMIDLGDGNYVTPQRHIEY